MQQFTIKPMTYTRPAPLSMEAKRESWQDGYSHALLQIGNFQAHARSPQHYADGYDKGQQWLQRHGIA